MASRSVESEDMAVKPKKSRNRLPGQAVATSTSAAGELQTLPNLGPRSRAILAAAGIQDLEQLRSLGSVAAYSLAKRSGGNVSLNLLWALEGALTNTPWQVVAREHRTSLLLALESLERDTRLEPDDHGAEGNRGDKIPTRD
jgi:DNA transformation protein